MKIRLFQRLLQIFGRLPLVLLQKLAQATAFLLWHSRSRMALVSRENISLCYPESSPQAQTKLAKQSLGETCKTIAETSIAWTHDHDHCLSLIVEVDGQTLVDDYRSRGKGLVFIMPHLGNWEMINHFLGHHYGLTHMYQANSNQALETLIRTCRARTGTQFVTADRRGVRAQLNVLRSGGCIGVMPDQEPDIHTGSFSAFFSLPALSSDLSSGLLNKTEANAVIASCLRLPNGQGFKIRFQDLGIERSNQGINNAIEQAIAQSPAQYLWSYKRFRTRPAGEIDYYEFGQHPGRAFVEHFLLASFFTTMSLFKAKQSRAIAKGAANGMSFLLRKRQRIAEINLNQCQQPAKLLGPSQLHLAKCLFETGRIWRSHDVRSMVAETSGSSLLESDAGTLVLTPPMGNRELVMAYLGQQFTSHEYYHPDDRSSRDQTIRRARQNHNINLVRHNTAGRKRLIQSLRAGEIVTACPDQQPRLRGGQFIPFFNIDALTTTALCELIKASHCQVVFGIAFRTDSAFTLSFVPLSLNLDALASDQRHQLPDEEILNAINQDLEAIIEQDPAQYRWSDKRFNIRPAGEAKFYSRH